MEMNYSALLLATVVALGFSSRSARGDLEPPARYSCEIIERTMRGRTVDSLRETQAVRRVVLHYDRAYRIEEHTERKVGVPTYVVLNNGDGSNQQFGLLPAKRYARLDLDSVKWLLHKHNPDLWKQQYGEAVPPPPSGNLLQARSKEDFELDRKLNPSTRLTVARVTELVDGKPCRLYHVTFQQLLDARTGRVDPETRFDQRLWIWEGRGIVLKRVNTSEYRGAKAPRPLARRTITTVSKLNLSPRLDRSRFELPAGTTATVFSDYPFTLPEGVIPMVFPGSGIDFGSRAMPPR
jgi:hypothetical protein